MRTKLLVLISAFLSYFTAQAQDTYRFTLLQNSDYNYSVAAIPNFAGNVSNPPNLESFGFTIMLQDGATVANIVLAYLNLDSATVIPAANLDAFDPGYDRSATLIASSSGDTDLPAHNFGDTIVLVTFDVLGSPTTGEISILDNNSALATNPNAGGALNSYFSADPTGGFAPSDVYDGQTGTTTYSFATLTTDEFYENKQGILIFPNPTKDLLNIDTKSRSTYQLIDMLGKTVTTGHLDQGTNELRLGTYKAGVYFLRLTDTKGSMTKKIVIE